MESKDVAARKHGGSWKRQDQTAQGDLRRRPLLKGIFALLLTVLCLSAELAHALRCGNRLVGMGASTAEVFDKCGEPVARDQWVEYRTVSPPSSFAPPQEQVYLPVIIEEWVYNFGAHRFMQKFHFEDGRLRDLQSLGYGE
jgi:hypothetical protein